MEIPLIFGRYKPLNVLKITKISRVMLVFDTLRQKECVLKVLLDESMYLSFLKEFKFLSELLIPNIIKAYDFGKDPSGLTYFTMEYLNGKTLQELLANADDIDNELSYEWIEKFIKEFLSTLNIIHSRGIFHGDIKPSNIYIVSENLQLTFKLLDFGFAGIDKETDILHKKGTLHYMPPEFFSGKQIGIESDLYSTGIVFYELCSKKNLFDSISVDKLVRDKLNFKIPSIKLIDKNCPDHIARLIDSLIEYDISLRPSSAKEALDILAISSGKDIFSLNSFQMGSWTGFSFFKNNVYLNILKKLESIIVNSNQTIKNEESIKKGKSFFINSKPGYGKTRLLNEIKTHIQEIGVTPLFISFTEDNIEDGFSKLLKLIKQLIIQYEHQCKSSDEINFFNTLDYYNDSAKAVIIIPKTINDEINSINILIEELIHIANIIYSNTSYSNIPLFIMFDDIHNADPFTLKFINYLISRISEIPLHLYITSDLSWFDKSSLKNEIKDLDSVSIHIIPSLSLDDIENVILQTFKSKIFNEEHLKQIYENTEGNFTFLNELIEYNLVEGILYFSNSKWHVDDSFLHKNYTSDSTKNNELFLQKSIEELDRDSIMLLLILSISKYEISYVELKKIFNSISVLPISNNISKLLKKNLIYVKKNKNHLIISLYTKRICKTVFALTSSQMKIEANYIIANNLLSGLKEDSYIIKLINNLKNESKIEDVIFDDMFDKMFDSNIIALAKYCTHGGLINEGKILSILCAKYSEYKYNFAHALIYYKWILDLFDIQKIIYPIDLQEKIADIEHQLGYLESAKNRYIYILNNSSLTNYIFNNSNSNNSDIIRRISYKLAATLGMLGNYSDAIDILVYIKNLFIDKNKEEYISFIAILSSYQLMSGNPDKAEKDVKDILENLNHEYIQSHISYYLHLISIFVNSLNYQNRFSEAEPIIFDAIKMATSFDASSLSSEELKLFQHRLADLYFALGLVYRGKCLFHDAISYWEKALSYYDSLQNLFFISKCYNNIGVGNYYLSNWKEAAESWEKFKQLAIKTKSKNEIANVCNNLGLLYKDLGQIDLAIKTLENGIKIAQECNFNMLLPTLYGNLGEAYYRLGDKNLADSFYAKAIDKAKTLKIWQEVVENQRRKLELIIFDYKKEEIDEFRLLLSDSLNLSKKIESKIEEAYLIAIKSMENAYFQKNYEAITGFEESELIITSLNSEIDLAKFLFYKGVAFRWMNLTSKAEDFFHKAEKIFEKLSANWDLKRVSEELRLLENRSKDSLDLKKLHLLLDVIQEINAERDINVLLHNIISSAIELAKAERGFIILYDSNANPIFYTTQHIARKEIEEGGTSKISSTITAMVLSTKKPVAITNVDHDIDLRAKESIVSLGLRSIICVPLKRGDSILGVLYVDSSRVSHEFYQSDLSLLEAFANAATISLENAQLLSSLQRKTDLMSILAHEIRTPLTAGVIFTKQLMRDGKNLSDEQQENLQSVLSQYYRLSRMINNIMDLAKMEANKIEWQMDAISIHSIINTTLSELNPICKEKNIKIEYEERLIPCLLHGNMDRLIQVCTNILSNALKYTSNGGLVKISTNITNKHFKKGLSWNKLPENGDSWATQTLKRGYKLSEESYLEVRISDSGNGILESDLEKIFDKFTQSPNSITNQSIIAGSGLGLSIAREIIIQHGGFLWAENDPNGGAVFIFQIPIVERIEN